MLHKGRLFAQFHVQFVQFDAQLGVLHLLGVQVLALHRVHVCIVILHYVGLQLVQYLILLVWFHVLDLPEFANDGALAFHAAAPTQTLHRLLVLFLRLDELYVIGQALEARENRGVVHEELPVGGVVPDLILLLEDQIVVKAEIRALILHLVRVDLFPLERIPVVLLKELVKQWVIFRHSGHVRVEDHFFLVQCSLVW